MLVEARRSIDRQMGSVREARQRAGNLLGYGSVVAAALGLRVGQDPLGVVGWVAVAAFLILGAAATFVLYPRRFHPDLGPAAMDAWFEDPSNTGVDHMIRSAALAHAENYDRDQPTIKRLHRAVSLAVMALVFETAALAANLVF